ncbi:MAG: RidA family protein, partial [Candidatus Omnitrophica bacterium]|nr:RidA family protein [Candidatus Omnitrophota bacterium]
MKRIISTPGAPVPKGPYSQAIISNGLLYISGQLSIEPASGALIHGDIER